MLFIISSPGIFGQGNSNCGSATPFCTGQTMQYPASTNAGAAQSGPYYGCLSSQPNPAWFFMQINTAGTMSIAMSAAQDIDFICWGPFSSLSGACANLTQSNMQSCSYSGSPTETCTIANAVAGQFYLMLITNFSNAVQNITFNQMNAGTSGAASTNCGFVCVVSATNSGIVCAGGAVTLSLTPNTSSAVSSYTWAGPNSYSSTSPLNYLNNIQSGGLYSVTATANSTINGVPYSQTCQATTSITVVPYPTFSISPASYTICQGGMYNPAVVIVPGNYNYNWTTTAPGMFATPTQMSTNFLPNLLASTVTQTTYVFAVSVSPTIYPCPTTKTSTLTILNPAPPVINQTPGLCDIGNPVQLTATPGGGTWSANPAVNPVGIFSPSLSSIGTQTVKYTISVGSCLVSNTNTLEVSKFNTAALSSSVGYMCALDAPLNLMNIVQNTVTGRWSGTAVTNNFFSPGTLPSGTYSLTYNTRSQPDTLVCPANTVMVIQIFNPPTPIISPILPKCTNAGSVVLTAIPPGGIWSNSSGITLNGIQTPSLCSAGINTVTYTAGQGTCVASSSKTFHVSQFRSAAITGTVPEQCFNFNAFNLMTIVQSTLGSWSMSTNGGVSHTPLP
ncbi:MAG: hypothetical protein JNL60_04915, partial [Bacteroidia bacterium]|nr:hypothetical protein [Bacteroidia bacterium]